MRNTLNRYTIYYNNDAIRVVEAHAMNDTNGYRFMERVTATQEHIGFTERCILFVPKVHVLAVEVEFDIDPPFVCPLLAYVRRQFN